MFKRIGFVFLMLALSTVLMSGACKKRERGGDGDGDTKRASKPAYQSKNDEGTITGVIKFEGDPPPVKKIDMSADPNCLKAGGDTTSDDIVVNNGKLANVFVYLKGGPADRFQYDTPSEAAVLDQKGCRYDPRVLGLQTNQTLRILNSDPTTHNIHPTPRSNPEWNEAQTAGAPPKEKKFAKPETLIPVKCNQHPWMKSNIGVLDHPFYAVSAQDGTYTIKNVPPGEYTLVAWHEVKGEQSQKITVGAKESKTQDFTFSAAKAYAPTSLEVAPALVLP